MRRFKSILFVADGGEGEKSVLARAVRLASANSAELTLFAALDAEGYLFDDPQTHSAIEAINKAHLEERREELLNAVDCSVLTLKPEGFETPIQV